MSGILLADDSPHAQRMGERILREEGFDVISVVDGESALKQLAEMDPDLMVVDVFLPGRNGFELCRYVKSQPQHKHMRVIMTAGLLEVFDEAEAVRAGADAIVKKPFEASAVMATIKPLVQEARFARTGVAGEVKAPAKTEKLPPLPTTNTLVAAAAAKARAVPAVALPPPPPVQAIEPLDPELVRAAVTVAVDAAVPALIDDITERVRAALRDNS